MKYIVFWILAKMVSAPCPDSGTNQYGLQSGYACAVFHGKIERDTLQKELNSRADALAFIAGAKPHEVQFFGDGIEKIWLDSVELKSEQSRCKHEIEAVAGHPGFTCCRKCGEMNRLDGVRHIEHDFSNFRQSIPLITTAEMPGYRFRELSPQDIPPNPFAMQDSIAALQKEVAELRAVVEKITQNPFFFQQGVGMGKYPIGESLAECGHPKTAQIGINHFCLSCGEKLTIKPGKSSPNNSHGN